MSRVTVVVHTVASGPYPSWLDESLLDLPSASTLVEKQGRLLFKWKPPGETCAFYIKQHRLSHRLHATAARLWPSKGWTPAYQEFVNLETARSAGVRVPEAVGAVEVIGPGSLVRGALAIRELVDHEPLHELLFRKQQALPASAFELYLRQVLEGVATSAAVLHGAGLFHKDLYLCHFFAPAAAQDKPRVVASSLVLIDFHRMRRHPYAYLHWQIKDLAQLGYSLRELQIPPSAFDYLLDCYFARLRLSSIAQATVRNLAKQKVERYWRHNWRRGTIWQPRSLRNSEVVPSASLSRSSACSDGAYTADFSQLAGERAHDLEPSRHPRPV